MNRFMNISRPLATAVFIMMAVASLLTSCTPKLPETQVIEEATEMPVAEKPPYQATAAMQQVLVYLVFQSEVDGSVLDLAWDSQNITPENWLGATTWRYQSGDWTATVSYPIVAPDATIYTVILTNQSTGFDWEGMVDANGSIQAGSAANAEATSKTPNLIHYEVPTYRILMHYPENLDFSIETPTPEVTSSYPRPVAVKLSQENYLLLIFFKYVGDDTIIRTGMPAGEMTVDGDLNILGTPVPRNVLTLDGKTKVVWYTWQNEVFEIHAFIDAIAYEDYLTVDIPDAYLSQADEILSGMTQTEPLRPIDPNEPIPAPAEYEVDGWTGRISKNPFGAQVQYMFQRQDGETFPLSGFDGMEMLAWRGSQVRLYGYLDEHGMSTILVEDFKVLEETVTEARNLSFFATPTASSSLPSDRWGTYHAWSAIDGDLTQPWSENAAGAGIEEWLMLQFPGVFELSAIGVDVGYDAPGAVFTRNHRIKTLRIVFSNGGEVTLDFKDERGIQLIPLARAPGPRITADTIRVYIEEVYPGSYYDDTCLGEIEIWGIVP